MYITRKHFTVLMLALLMLLLTLPVMALGEACLLYTSDAADD